MKSCPKCGAENRNIAKFCHVCQESIYAVKPVSAGKGMMVVAMGAGLVILAAVVGYLLFERSGPRNKIVASAPTVFISITTPIPVIPQQPTMAAPAEEQKPKKKVIAAAPRIQPTMVLIPAGEFRMGSPAKTEPENQTLAGNKKLKQKHTEEKKEQPQHTVYLDAFYIDKYPVTFDQYDEFCKTTGRAQPNDNGWGRGERPVINVSWNDANAYAQWAGKRLPTEAEYEKAIRGGTTTEYFWGDDESQAGDYAWYEENSGGMTRPVGEKKPNSYGLYDIVGNVFEWCSDWFDAIYYKTSPARNPKGPEQMNGAFFNPYINRVMRGGVWRNSTDSLRSSHRAGNSPNITGNIFGFRCVKDAN